MTVGIERHAHGRAAHHLRDNLAGVNPLREEQRCRCVEQVLGSLPAEAQSVHVVSVEALRSGKESSSSAD